MSLKQRFKIWITVGALLREWISSANQMTLDLDLANHIEEGRVWVQCGRGKGEIRVHGSVWMSPRLFTNLLCLLFHRLQVSYCTVANIMYMCEYVALSQPTAPFFKWLHCKPEQIVKIETMDWFR